MRVLAMVHEQEVFVSIGADEIADALRDAPNEKCTWVLNTVAQVLRAISNVQIHEQMNTAQRAVIHGFLAEQAARYLEPERCPHGYPIISGYTCSACDRTTPTAPAAPVTHNRRWSDGEPEIVTHTGYKEAEVARMIRDHQKVIDAKRKSCPRCYGTGAIDAPTSADDPSCPNCDGEGHG